jgi:hypothetical protein
MATIKNTKNNKCWHESEKLEPLYTAGGNVSYHNHYENLYGVSSKT